MTTPSSATPPVEPPLEASAASAVDSPKQLGPEQPLPAEAPQDATPSPHAYLPISVHLELLKNVSESDALQYVEGFIDQKTTSKRPYFGVFPFANGFIVEVQEGGSAKAYTPALIAALESDEPREAARPLRALIHTAQNEMYVSISPDSLHSMVIVEGCEVQTDMTLAPSVESLSASDMDHGKRFMKTARRLFAISVGVLILAAVLQPSGPSLELAPVKAKELPLAQWVNELTWPANERPVAVRLDAKTQKLVVSTKKDDAGLSLKSGANAAQAAPASASQSNTSAGAR